MLDSEETILCQGLGDEICYVPHKRGTGKAHTRGVGDVGGRIVSKRDPHPDGMEAVERDAVKRETLGKGDSYR